MLTCLYFTGGIDCVSGPYTVTISAGQTSASFDFRIINTNYYTNTRLTAQTFTTPSPDNRYINAASFVLLLFS